MDLPNPFEELLHEAVETEDILGALAGSTELREALEESLRERQGEVLQENGDLLEERRSLVSDIERVEAEVVSVGSPDRAYL